MAGPPPSGPRKKDPARPTPDQEAPTVGEKLDQDALPELTATSPYGAPPIDPACYADTAALQQDATSPGADGSLLDGNPIPPGGKRFGQYLIKSELGRGGMGVVYRALHIDLNREVALKLMLSRDVPQSERARFLSEAEASASLKHPAIVPVYDVGIEQGSPYFSMDFIEGKTLRTFMMEHSTELPLLLGILAKVCDGVGYAHRKGIIHRDLKPQNIMVDDDLQPHIMDFGLAVRINGPAAPHRSQSLIEGTPIYMPPEQAVGAVDLVDTRSDIYSLGVILYMFLAGSPPFMGNTVQELYWKIANEEPVPPRQRAPDCPWELERVAMKTIRKDRDARYQSAFDLGADLLAWVARRPVSAAGSGGAYRARKFVQRNRGAVAIGALAIAALTAAGVATVHKVGAPAREARARAAVLARTGREKLVEAQELRQKLAARAADPTPEEAPEEAVALPAAAVRAFGEAREDLAAALQIDSENVDLVYAASQAESGRVAMKALEEAALKEQARVLATQEARSKAAALAADAAVALRGVDPFALDDLAAAAVARERIEGARDDCVQAIALDPSSVTASALLSTAVVAKLGALTERESVFAQKQRLAELGGEIDAALVAARATPAEARAHLRKAIEALTVALRIDAKDPARLDAAVAIGTLAVLVHHLDLAEHVADEVAGLGGDRVAGFLAMVRRAGEDEGRYQAEYEAGEVALVAEDLDRAAASFQRALLAAPGRPEAEFGVRFSRGGQAERAARHVDALALYREAARFALRPVDGRAIDRAIAREQEALAASEIAAADEALKAGRYDDADRALLRALALAPASAAAKRLRAEVLARKSKPLRTVLVPEGPFTYGVGADALSAVTCSAFYIGTIEVTNGEFAEFVRAGGYEREDLWDADARAARGGLTGQDGRPGPLGWSGSAPPSGKDDLPVAGVSWWEARAYARWRGDGWRLPGEREWEKAATWETKSARKMDLPWLARGPDGDAVSTWRSVWRAYYNGTEPKPVGAPFGRNASGAPLYDSSPCEALDMWGNVRELVVAGDGSQGESPAVRGGSFASRIEKRSTAYVRFLPAPDYRALDVGFRLAKSAGP